MNDKLEMIHDVLKIQGSDGNWDFDPYMHGLYNGMEMIASILEDREPVFRDAPEIWGFEKERPITTIGVIESHD